MSTPERPDILEAAVTRRISSYRREAIMHAALGVLAFAAGAALFWFLWTRFRVDDSEFVSQLAGISTTLTSAGAGGFLVNRFLALRSEIRDGQEWLSLYDAAIGPPPHVLASDVQQKMLSWLER